MLRAVISDLLPPSLQLSRPSKHEASDAPVGPPSPPRRTPRKSLVVVVPENQEVSADVVAERVRAAEDELVDVIVAYAGRPADLVPLQHKVRDVQVLLVPSGTSVEELRMLAIRQAQGDIVTLLTGHSRSVSNAELPTASQL